MNRFTLLFAAVMLTACSKQSTDEYLSSAEQLIAKNDYQAASIELKNAIKQAPEHAQARFLLGKVYLAQQQYQNAEKELNRALELKYPAEQVVPLLSQSYQKSRSDVALLGLSYKEKGFSAEQSAQVAFYQVQAMFRLDKQDKAKTLINDIQQLDTDSVYKQLAFVYSLILDKQNDAAQLELDAIIKQDPSQPDALKLQAILYAQAGKLVPAVEHYLSYLKHYPNDLEISFVTARLLVGLNRTQEAEPLIDKLLAINENNGLLNQLKGIARFNDKDMASALSYSEKALIVIPEDPAVRLLAGYAAYQLADYEKAQQHLSIIAQELPAEHQALKLLAASQLQLGLNSQAGDTISAIEGLTDKDNALVSSIGLALVQSGDVEQARTLLDKSDQLMAETAEDLTRLGLLKLSLNDVSGITKLELALDKKPEQKFTRQTLATAYLSTKQYDKAIELAQRWKAENAQDAQAYMLEGSVYLQRGDFDQAKQQLSQILQFEPTSLPAQMGLAQLAIQQRDYQQAKQYLDKVLALQPDHIAALVKLYALGVMEKSPDSAIETIERQFKQNSDNQALRLLLAKVYLQEQRYNESISLLADFPQTQAPLVYWQTIGRAYFKVKQFDKLTALYQQWLAIAPNNRHAVLGNLMLLDNQRKYAQALELSTKFLEKNAKDLEVKLFNIHFLLLNGELTKAKAAFEQVDENAKNIPFAKGLHGQIQMSQKQFAQALPNIQAAYQEQPTPRNANLIQICLRNLGQTKQANEFLQQHVTRHPNDVESLMQLAQLQISTDVDGAINSYQQALKINENNFIALNNLAYFYLERNQLDKAQQYGERALAIRPEMPDVLDTVARIHLAKKEYAQAVKYLTKAVNNENVKDEIYLNFVEALLLDEQLVLAKRKLSQRTFTDPKSSQRAQQLKQKL